MCAGTFHTDNGPECTACGGTIWSYLHDLDAVACECASCNAVEVYARTSDFTDAVEAREAHVTARHNNQTKVPA